MMSKKESFKSPTCGKSTERSGRFAGETSVERKVFEAIEELLRLRALGDEFQVRNEPADRDSILGGEYNSREEDAASLAISSFNEKIFILRYENTSEAGRAVEKNWIDCSSRAVTLSRKDIDTF
jgi:hypothetical protein